MITRQTKLILYNVEKEIYEIGTLKDQTADQIPVCTIDHFMHTVCKLFEDVTPEIGGNPMYQNINWETVPENEVPEVKV